MVSPQKELCKVLLGRQGHSPLSVGGVEGEPTGDESFESRYQVASSMRDLLLERKEKGRSAWCISGLKGGRQMILGWGH